MMQQTRTFKVTDLREGLRTIKREVGDNAVILSTSRQPDGTVEMTVALANEPKREPPTEAPIMNPEQAEFVALTQMVVELKSQISSLASEVRRSDRQTPSTSVVAVRKEQSTLSAGVLQDIRMAVARINDRGAEDTFARSVALMYEWLTRHGVLHGHVEELLAHAFAASEVWEEEPAMLHELVKREMEARIETTPPLWSSRAEGCEVVVLMGSTGVGKTTTAAKIAAHASVVGGKKVGLICADTFRIGAAYQVETYAELLNIPIRLASSMAELRTALQAFANFDLVIIDTMEHTP
jgi:flagellar biosynthesis protein FlhF